jgi:lysophospholipase L1-like esterase
MNQYFSRRGFIRKAGAGGMLALSIPQIVEAAYSGSKNPGKITLRKDDIILFQGDSITDSGRNREEPGVNNSAALGDGYPMLAASQLLADHADKNLKIFNRGISGNKVFQLAERWRADCEELKPTVLSILIGVNDFWHMVDGKYSGTIETYKTDFKTLMERTTQKLPGIKVIIGEPFAIPGIKAVDEKWFPAFYEYQKAAREIADQFNAVFIPYQHVFDEAAKSAPPSYWTYDGVHPSLPGSELMSRAWLKSVQ